MSKLNSTSAARSSKSSKPEKPARSFIHPQEVYPLFPHNSGHWCKKVRGSFVYFGRWDAVSAEEAEQRWENEKDELLAGRKPGDGNGKAGATVRQVCADFLTTKKNLRDAGELAARTCEEYAACCRRVEAAFGKGKLVSDLTPKDFEKYRTKLAKTRGPVSIFKEIQLVRCLFKYAFDAELIERPVKFGPGFKRPSKKVLRLDRKKHGPKLFTAEEIRAMLNGALAVGKDGPELVRGAGQPMRAMILLALNAGYGNADCGRLPMESLDLKRGWVSYHREKTGVDRRCPLWPETIQAIREAMDQRPAPQDDLAGRVFVTSAGGSWFKDASDNPVSKEMRKLLDRLGMNGHRNFYTLRHTFRTVADGTKDQPAIDHIMGHESPDMASVYRESIDDERLRAVVEHVRRWLFGDGKEGGAE